MRLAEVVDSPKSAQEFIDYNHITPREIIVIWDEDWDEETEIEKYNKGIKKINEETENKEKTK